jgi:hypothetical protein
MLLTVFVVGNHGDMDVKGAGLSVQWNVVRNNI